MQLQALYLEGRFNRGFFALRGWGGGAYIWRGLYVEGLIFGILRYVPHYDAPKPGPENHKFF